MYCPRYLLAERDLQQRISEGILLYNQDRFLPALPLPGFRLQNEPPVPLPEKRQPFRYPDRSGSHPFWQFPDFQKADLESDAPEEIFPPDRLFQIRSAYPGTDCNWLQCTYPLPRPAPFLPECFSFVLLLTYIHSSLVPIVYRVSFRLATPF